MTAHDPKLVRKAGLLRWLGFGGSDVETDDDPATSAPEGIANEGLDDRRERRRRELLEDIAGFLLAHRIEVTAYTLAIAYDVMSGSNPRLARLIEQRATGRRPVTQDWLEDAASRCGRNDGTKDLTALMGKLEATIEEFGQTASAARTATTEYNSALEAQVGELERVSKAGLVISELASIARIMLDRTRNIELEMARSESQTQTLHKRLEQARKEAELDHLTGLPNRRAFDAVFDRECGIARDNGEALCVAFCDIDNFKRINDTHGHEAGDRVLRAVAQSLARISSDRCHVARHGGEEFVVLLRGRNVDEAWAELDGAREAMGARRLVNRATDIPFGMITFSAGIADVFACESGRAALKAADDALYAAKNRGRNQVVRADDLNRSEAA